MTTVTTKNAYFDLSQFVAEIRSPEVASQMAQSIAFAVDVALANAARQLLKNLRTSYAEFGFESMSEMTMALEDSAFAEQAMHQAGKDDLGPVATIQQLHLVREHWHELAADLTRLCFTWQGVPRNYEIKPIEEFLTREVKMQVKPLTAHRIKTLVTRRNNGASEEDIAKVVERRLQREEQKLKDASAAMTQQQGAIVSMYNLALLWGDAQYSTEFYTLHPELRRSLIEAAIKGAARAEEFACSSSHITDVEFDEVCFAVLTVERQLKAVLAGVSEQRPVEA